MITGKQIRMAIAGLGWSLQDLADKSGISWRTVQKIAKTDGVSSSSGQTLAAIEAALQEAGIEFIAENGGGAGVRFRERSEG